MYLDTGHRFIIVSSTKSLFKQRQRDPRWIIYNKSRKGTGSITGTMHRKGNKAISFDRYTYSYEYIGLKNDNSLPLTDDVLNDATAREQHAQNPDVIHGEA